MPTNPAARLAAYRTHARGRYRQRWGRKLSAAAYGALCRAVADRGRWLYDSGPDRAVFGVLFRGDWLRAVVDLPLEAVVTVLPRPEGAEGPDRAPTRGAKWWKRPDLA